MNSEKWCSRKNVFVALAAACSLAVTVAAGTAVGQTAGVNQRDLAKTDLFVAGDAASAAVQRDRLQRTEGSPTLRYGARFTGDIPEAPPIIVDYREFLGQPPATLPVAVASGVPTGQVCDFNIECSDCNPCTLDSCSGGACTATPINDVTSPNAGFGCDNNDDCFGVCVDGSCPGTICTSDIECCGDPPDVSNGTCQFFECELFDEDRCVNADIEGRFVPGSACDDGLTCNASGPQPTCEGGVCVDGEPLKASAKMCDASSADFGQACSDDEDCEGEDVGRCTADICDDTNLQCSGAAPACEDDPDPRCAGDARCIAVELPCDELLSEQICQELTNTCAAPCSSDADCDTDQNSCTFDVCCTGGVNDPPQCDGFPVGTCTIGPNICGPGGNCTFDPDQQLSSCGSGRCCDLDGDCALGTFKDCVEQPTAAVCAAGPCRWLATNNACSKFVVGGEETALDNDCPLYSSGIAPPDSPVGTAIGPVSFFAPCPGTLRRVGDDYSFPTLSGFAEVHAFRWLSAVQFPARFTVEFYEPDPQDPNRPMFSGQIFFPVVGVSVGISGPVIRTVLFEPPLPVPADGFFALKDAAEFTNRLGTFTAFATGGVDGNGTPQVGTNDTSKMLIQRATDPELVIFESLGQCNGGDRDGLWCDTTGGPDDPGCPGFGGGGTCVSAPAVLSFEIVGQPLDDPALGGCCDRNTGSCTVESVANCLDGGGVFRGVGVGCAVCLGEEGNLLNGEPCGPGTNEDCSSTGAVCTERVCELDVGEACTSTTDCDQALNFCVFTGTTDPSGEVCPDGNCPEGQTCVVNACVDIAQCQVQAVCDTATGVCSVESCPEVGAGEDCPAPDPDGFGWGTTCDPNCCTVPREAITKKLCDGGGRDLQVCQVDADCPDGACKQVFARCRAIGTVESPVARTDLFAPASHDCDPTKPVDLQGCGVGEFCDGIALSGGDNCTQAQVGVIEVPSSANPDIVVTVTQTGSNFLARFDDWFEGVCDGGPKDGQNCSDPPSDPSAECDGSPCVRKAGALTGVADPDGTSDPLWWEGFQMTFPAKTAIGDNCAWIRHDFCCSEDAIVPSWAGLWTGCPAGPQVPANGAPPPIGLGRREGTLGRGSGFCLPGDINVVGSFGPAGPGTYYKPLLSFPGSTRQPPITGGEGGTYQNHFSAAACPQAACCVALCEGGNGQFDDRAGRPCNPDGLEACPGPGAECINGRCVGGIFEGLPCGENADGQGGFVDQCPGGTCGAPGCALSNELECLTAGGFFNAQPFLPEDRGTLVSCGTDPNCSEGAGSDNPCCIGACCLGPGLCEDEVNEQPDTMTEAACNNLNGDFVGGPRCDFELPACPICRVTGVEHCQFSNQGVLFGFFVDRTAGNAFADDFKAVGTELTEVCWQTFFGTGPPGGVGDPCALDDITWEVTVYDEQNGLPANVLKKVGPINIDVETGITIDEDGNVLAMGLTGEACFGADFPCRQLSLTLAESVTLVENERYWIEYAGRGAQGECHVWTSNSNVEGNLVSMFPFTLRDDREHVWSFLDRVNFENDWRICVDVPAQFSLEDNPYPTGACCLCDGTCLPDTEHFDCVDFFDRFFTAGGVAPIAIDATREGGAHRGVFTADATCGEVRGCENVDAAEACPGEGSGIPGDICQDAIHLNTAGICDGGDRTGLYCCASGIASDCGRFADPGCPGGGTCVALLDPSPSDDEEAIDRVVFNYNNFCSSTAGRLTYAAGICDNNDLRFGNDLWFTYKANFGTEDQGTVEFDIVATDFDVIMIAFTDPDNPEECPQVPFAGGDPEDPGLCRTGAANSEPVLSKRVVGSCIDVEGGNFPAPDFSTFADNGQCFLVRVGGDLSAAALNDAPRTDLFRGIGKLFVQSKPTACVVAEPAVTDSIQTVTSRKNRFLTITTGDEASINRGRSHAVRVTIESLPPPFDGLAPAELWLGVPTGSGSDVERLSSIAGTGLGGAIPSSDARFTRVAQLRCGPPASGEDPAFFRDWTNLHSCRGGGAGVNATNCDPTDPGACGSDPSLCLRDRFIHMRHPLIIPGGEYSVRVIDSSCDPGAAASFSGKLVLDTPKFGDVAGGTNCSPPAENTWCASDGNTVVGDVVAAIDTFGNKPIGPIKPRAEAAGLGVSPVDGIIGVSDLVIWVDAVLGKPLTATPMAPPNVPPCPALSGTAAAGQ